MVTRGIFLVADDEKVCCNCKHFIQYYLFNARTEECQIYHEGLCLFTKHKHRKSTQAACKHFQQENGDGNVWQKKSVDYRGNTRQVEYWYRDLYIRGHFNSSKHKRRKHKRVVRENEK